MTATVRTRVTLGPVGTSAPLPPMEQKPLAPLEPKTGRHRLTVAWMADPDRPLVRVRPLVAARLLEMPPRRRFAPWLVFALYALLVPLLFATLAVLAGCVPEDGGTGPVRQVLPEISTDSPRSWIVPTGVR